MGMARRPARVRVWHQVIAKTRSEGPSASMRSSYLVVDTFEVVCEIEPATRPDLMRVRRQIGVLSTIATRFLIPDNHIGRATVSSVGVAHEVAQMGCRAVACVNARDRNLLGFRRDLLTAAAYGVEEFLFVYGDRPETGRRSDDLTVRSMIDMARDFAEEQASPMRIGVPCGLGAVPEWKRHADVWYLQVSYDLDAMISWRSGIEFDGAIFAGVMALPSATMARKVSTDVPQLAVPRTILDRLDADPNAGVDLAVELVTDVRDSKAFDGVHLISVNRYRQVATALEPKLR
jgi:5,10-methylenetetrahydrofolate reductase